MGPQVLQNYHTDCEGAVNRMVNVELNASYVYLSMVRAAILNLPNVVRDLNKMAYHFRRDDVALKHVAAFMEEESLKKTRDAEKLLEYQNKRGGSIILQDIQKPEEERWDSTLDAFQNALRLEKNVNQALLDSHQVALEKGDPHLCDFLKSHFLGEQVKTIKQLGDHLSNLQRLGVPLDGMGEHLFDKLTLGTSS